MKAPQAEVAALIRKIRQIIGVTQVEMAQALGITPTSIHRYEAGTSVPNVTILRDLLAFAAQNRGLATEQKALEQIVQVRTGGSRRAQAAASKARSTSHARRPLLDVNVLVSLSEAEHNILEAALAVVRGQDETAKRTLFALLQPWLPTTHTDDMVRRENENKNIAPEP